MSCSAFRNGLDPDLYSKNNLFHAVKNISFFPDPQLAGMLLFVPEPQIPGCYLLFLSVLLEPLQSSVLHHSLHLILLF